MANHIDPTYLPFEQTVLAKYLACADGQYLPDGNLRAVRHYMDSAGRYRSFNEDPANRDLSSLARVRKPRQMEKDERFWTAAALIALDLCGDRVENWNKALTRAFGEQPTWPGESWRSLLGDDFHLLLEVPMPSPKSYYEWLSIPDNWRAVNPVKYVRDAAGAAGSRQALKTRLEGATHADAMLVSTSGFAVVFEAKVTSDISHSVSFDATRNQLARVIDVTLECREKEPSYSNRLDPRSLRSPDRTLIALLTPRMFQREYRYSRLYGWLFDAYKGYGRNNLDLLSKHLPHRKRDELAGLPDRLGWLSYQDCNDILPADGERQVPCPWLIVS
jgi:hypothetical protein